MQKEIIYGLILVLIQSGLLASLAVAARSRLDAYLGVQRAGAAIDIARSAVAAAEQVATRAGWVGPAKYAAALRYARDFATAHGVTLTDDQWRVAIEAAVRDMQAASAILVGVEADAGRPDAADGGA